MRGSKAKYDLSMPDPGLPGALILILAVVVAVAVVWLVARGRRGGHRAGRGGAVHGMAREESLSYFRDYSEDAKAPGVREEDRGKPWGEGDSKPPG
jgi:hypothetical protein